MSFALATVLAGSLMAVLSLLSLVRAASRGMPFVSQIRFFLSGVLLALHVPAVHFLDGLLLPHLQGLGSAALAAAASFWAATAIVVSVQLIILPTSRELYAPYLEDRFGRPR